MSLICQPTSEDMKLYIINKVEVAVLGSLSLILLNMVSVDVEQH